MPPKSFAFGTVALAIVWGVFFYPPPPPAAAAPQADQRLQTRVSAIPPGASIPAQHTVLR